MYYSLKRYFYTLNICNLSLNAMDIQSGRVELHRKLLISASAWYAKIGSMGGEDMIDDKSQINACESSPAVQI